MRIVVDGNIGSGKSTQLKLLAHSGFRVFREPTEEWPLESFYKNPREWAYPLQLSILKSRQKCGNGIYERCPYTSTYVFWETLLDQGTVGTYDDLRYRSEYREFGWSPDIYIYIDTPVDICMERIKSREGSGDALITRDYLESLHTRYTRLWDTLDCPKAKVDGSQGKWAVLHQIKKGLTSSV